ncbi:MAG: DUF2059 domain-containing protein [Paludibacter sp.]
MKKPLFLLLLCISIFTNANARTKQEAVKELIHVMKNDSMINKMIDAMVPAMATQMQSEMKDSTAKARSEEVMKIAMETVKDLSPKLTDMMASIYEKYYTEKEINDFLVFYKSPTGQKSINIMPQIMKEMMGEMMKSYIPEMQKTLKARIGEFSKSKK